MYLAGRGKAVDHRQLTTQVGSSLGSWTVRCAQWFLNNIVRGLGCSVLLNICYSFFFFLIFNFFHKDFSCSLDFEKGNPKQPPQNKNKQTNKKHPKPQLYEHGRMSRNLPWIQNSSAPCPWPLWWCEGIDWVIHFLLFIRFFLCFTQSKCWGSPKVILILKINK